MVNSPENNREATDDVPQDAVLRHLDEFFEAAKHGGPVRAFYEAIAGRETQFGNHHRLVPGPGPNANNT